MLLAETELEIGKDITEEEAQNLIRITCGKPMDLEVAEVESEEIDLSNMTKSELTHYGKQSGIDLNMTMTRVEMLAILGRG